MMHDASFEGVAPRLPLLPLNDQAKLAEKHGIETLLFCPNP